MWVCFMMFWCTWLYVECNFVAKIEKCEKTDWKEVIQKSQFEKDC